MADSGKLSVGRALDALRGTEPRKTKITKLNDEIDALDRETQRLRAERKRIERDQKGSAPGHEDEPPKK